VVSKIFSVGTLGRFFQGKSQIILREQITELSETTGQTIEFSVRRLWTA
jgi:hypothetical protein